MYGFSNEVAIHVALASPQTQRVMADVKNFTDTTVSKRVIWTL